MNLALKRLVPFYLLMQAAWPVLAEENTARILLEQMAGAMMTSNYRGTFIYHRAGRIDAMQIVHALREGDEREKLLSLTGPEREVIRNNQMVTCILGDKQSVVLNQSQPRKSFPARFPENLDKLESYYDFKLTGTDRVAGLKCQLVAVQPRDQYRYGRRLCILRDNNILLRSETTNEKGEAVEQVMFTSIDFPRVVDEEELRPNYQGKSYHWVREPALSFSASKQQTDGKHWQFSEVPPGFMLTDHRWHHLSETEPAVEHWVLSDGLASISVYIEQAKPQAQTRGYSGITRRGALNAYGTMVRGHYVTVVGEVPLLTLEQIGQSISYIP